MLGDILKKNELKRQRFLPTIRKGITPTRATYFSPVTEVNPKEPRMASTVARTPARPRFERSAIQLMRLPVVAREA